MESELFDLDTALSLMEKFNNEVFKIVLPNSHFLSGCHSQKIVGHFSYNNLFAKTRYEVDLYDSFIHFTSLQALSSILNNGWFRLSEFRHFEDKNELHYASRIFNDDSFQIKNKKILDVHKQNCFALSASLFSDDNIKNKHMWDGYGNKGEGVVIRFKINHYKESKFLLGKIQYGQENLGSILSLNKLAEKFKLENQGFVYDDFPERIIELLAFHKSADYYLENEIRLFLKKTKEEYEKHKHEAIYEDITPKNEVRYFFKMFLEERKSILELEINDQEVSDEYFQFYPTIQIEEITLGYKLENKIEIFQFLNSIKERFNYKFKLSQMFDDFVIREYR